MTRPHLIGTPVRGDGPSGPADLARTHTATAAQVAAMEDYGGRLISIGSSEGSHGPGLVTLTGARTYPDAVVLEFRRRDGRPGSRRVAPATTILIHRTRTGGPMP